LTKPALPKPLADLIRGTDDADLLVRLRRKDPEAVGLLYDRYGRTAYSLALRIVGDSVEAESVVSKAVLKCWNRIASFRQARGSALGVWLLLTTYVTAISHRRGQSPQMEDWSFPCHPMAEPSLFHGWQKELDGDHVQALFAALVSMAAQEQEVLNRAFLEGANPNDLTALLGCSRTDLDELIASALSKLQHAD
jgi:RNA polymerase sigma-70 factor (ECF subfamily)